LHPPICTVGDAGVMLTLTWAELLDPHSQVDPVSSTLAPSRTTCGTASRIGWRGDLNRSAQA